MEDSPENADEAFEKVRSMLMLQTLGLNFAEYIKYQFALKSVHAYENTDNGINVNRGGATDPEEEDAKYVVNYVIDAIVQIESYVGDIEKPFGLEYSQMWKTD